MLLASTCRAWHELITEAPVNQLSEQARGSLLPSGLTSALPLLELVKQQNQLMARLRCELAVLPRIQRLSFKGCQLGDREYAAESQGPASEHEGSVADDNADLLAGSSFNSILSPHIHFQRLIWSPQSSSQDADRWIILQPHLCCRNTPIVVDVATGQQVEFHMDGSEPSDRSARAWQPPHSCAAWLRDGHHALFLAKAALPLYVVLPDGIGVADAISHGASSVETPGPYQQYEGRSNLLTVRSHDGCMRDVLCWTESPIQRMHVHGQVAWLAPTQA